ncbi:DUF3306 domain-containing protein [Oceanicella actignis]|uniref:DUF3306 domain-containing protein n=1 Tax=Oceanicella actignis TaxID=1189325 RepID=UPI0011E88E81|nr:DUF3306 domain-containing protein [Oceanicella actignis]TYO90471.1 uncharacterized protein DUF3306 [Oceanicella actignis]
MTPPDSDRPDGFLARWSARKRRAAAPREAKPPAPPAERAEGPAHPAPPEAAPTPQARSPGARPAPEGGEAGAPGREESDEEALARLNLPAPETLGPEGDFSAFLRADAPESLRRRALRALWRAKPGLGAPDGLLDYAEDFTDRAVGAGAVSTIYQVGRGLAAAWESDSPEAPRPDPRPAAEAGAAATGSEPETAPASGDAAGRAVSPRHAHDDAPDDARDDAPSRAARQPEDAALAPRPAPDSGPAAGLARSDAARTAPAHGASADDAAADAAAAGGAPARFDAARDATPARPRPRMRFVFDDEPGGADPRG